MANQFIPSPVPVRSHYDQPGIMMQPPPSNLQNPAPSSSPCQECAIHNTIIQSMAFSMQNMDYANCHHLHANASCTNCYSKYNAQQPADQNFYSLPIYRTQCGHNLAEDYSRYTCHAPQNTQTLLPVGNAVSDAHRLCWNNENNNNSISHDDKFPQAHHPGSLAQSQCSYNSDYIGANPSIVPEGHFMSDQIRNSSGTYALVQAENASSAQIPSNDQSIFPKHLPSKPSPSPTVPLADSPLDQLTDIARMNICDVSGRKAEIKMERIDGNEKKRKSPIAVDKRVDSRPIVRKRQPEDICAVCGDRASGYHYNALTCEGCKGFFRRSITNKTSYKQGCKQGGNCEMDTYTRRKCPHCRFKKCKEVGMLEECLLTEIQCRSKRIRRQQRKQQQQRTNEDPPKSDHSSPSAGVTSPEQSSAVSSPSGSDGSQNSDYQTTLALTDDEVKLIDTVAAAFKKYKINPEIVRKWEEYINKESNTTCRLSDITTVHVQVLVEYAKTIPGFLLLEYPDQIALLKGSIFEAMLIRNSCGFHHLRRDINKSAILEEVGVEPRKFEALLDFFNSIGKLGMDEIEYGLLIAIVIFNSDYDFVKNKELIDEYQDMYLSALAKYSMARSPTRTSIFPRILAMLTEIRSLSHNNAEIVSSWKRRGALTPLLCEIWDLE